MGRLRGFGAREEKSREQRRRGASSRWRRQRKALRRARGVDRASPGGGWAVPGDARARRARADGGSRVRARLVGGAAAEKRIRFVRVALGGRRLRPGRAGRSRRGHVRAGPSSRVPAAGRRRAPRADVRGVRSGRGDDASRGVHHRRRRRARAALGRVSRRAGPVDPSLRGGVAARHGARLRDLRGDAAGARRGVPGRRRRVRDGADAHRGPPRRGRRRAHRRAVCLARRRRRPVVQGLQQRVFQLPRELRV
mmetsp:Transcript_11391/g.47741  ORF Transcript_11391/g.47741 Transcript_11391/m.47741 type:complete len:252 (+) Transcript_11391:356-1111(+)